MTTPFNLDWYLLRNPDVAASVQAGLIDARTHFELFGKEEGRHASPLFDPDTYLADNPDVARAVREGHINVHDHFMSYGLAEGRNPLRLFDQDLYLKQNADVNEAVRAGQLNAVQHLLMYGASESRLLNFAIDLGRYMEANADVQAAVQQNVMTALEHLIMFGVKEGRDLGNGVRLEQFRNDPVFNAALDSGQALAALQRVQEVAPFISSFERPANWSPPADLPLPHDFRPVGDFRLTVPADIKTPPGTALSDKVFEVKRPDTNDPTPPAPTFNVEQGLDGHVSFVCSVADGVRVTIDNGVMSFAMGDLTAETTVAIATITGMDAVVLKLAEPASISAADAQVLAGLPTDVVMDPNGNEITVQDTPANLLALTVAPAWVGTFTLTEDAIDLTVANAALLYDLGGFDAGEYEVTIRDTMLNADGRNLAEDLPGVTGVTLLGSPGAQVITASAGADIFKYEARELGGNTLKIAGNESATLSEGDLILGFQAGVDKIDLSSLLNGRDFVIAEAGGSSRMFAFTSATESPLKGLGLLGGTFAFTAGDTTVAEVMTAVRAKDTGFDFGFTSRVGDIVAYLMVRDDGGTPDNDEDDAYHLFEVVFGIPLVDGESARHLGTTIKGAEDTISLLATVQTSTLTQSDFIFGSFS